jgi:hypothetical protein
MLLLVGTGTQLVDVDEGAIVVLGLTGVVDAAGQVYTVVDKTGAGEDGPVGGYLFLQPPREQELPGQNPLQYLETELHQLENWKQFKLSGKPAEAKQDANWTLQEETAFKQDGPSLKGGRGLEHHFPHLYSHVGAGAATVTVDVHRETLVLVDEVVGGGGGVVTGVVLDFDELVLSVDLLDVVQEVVGLLLLEGVVIVGLVLVVQLVLAVVLTDEVVDWDFVVLYTVRRIDKISYTTGTYDVVEVVDEEEGGEALQGSLDSKSLATYKFKVPLPPQVSVESPVQAILHLLASIGRVPFPRTTPQ